VVGSSFPVGLPPTPATVTAPLGFEDAVVLGFFIYKYRIPSSCFTLLSLTVLHPLETLYRASSPSFPFFTFSFSFSLFNILLL